MLLVEEGAVFDAAPIFISRSLHKIPPPLPTTVPPRDARERRSLTLRTFTLIFTLTLTLALALALTHWHCPSLIHPELFKPAMAPSDIHLRIPSKYAPPPKSPPGAPSSPSSPPSAVAFANPPLDWLHRTWTVTHSTLAMWRTAQNVRITYTPLPPSPPTAAGSCPRVDDLVTYEKKAASGASTKLKTVAGIDTACSSSDTGSWDWRGKGLLGFVTSHWEVLGWGEREVDGQTQRWVVTWFAPTLFTKEGVDLYSDQKGGMDKDLATEVVAALKGLGEGAAEVVKMVEADMREVTVVLPWKEA